MKVIKYVVYADDKTPRCDGQVGEPMNMTVGKEYPVIREENNFYRVLNDNMRSGRYMKSRFLPSQRTVHDVVGVELGKRTSLDGVSIDLVCPNCNEDVERDFEHDYLSHPVVGKTEDLTVYCEHCDHNWSAGTIKLNLQAEIVLK